jgi:tetratricopeptide (TPR) repeat protein
MALFREIGDSFGLAGLLNGPVTYLVWNQGNFDQSKKYAEEALAIYQKHADQDGIAWAYLRLGEIAAREGNYIQAWNLMDIAQDLYCRIDSKYGKPMVLLLMGKTARAQGDPQHAQEIFTEVLDLTRQAGDRFQMAIILKNLAQAAFDLGDYSRASQRYHESLETSREIDFRPAISRALRGLAEVSLAAQAAGGNSPALQLYKEALQVRGNPPDRREIYRSLEALAGLAVDLGQPEQAGRLFSATQSLYESVRFSFWPLHRFNRAEMVSSLRDRLGETAFDKVWSQGQALTLDQTIQLALSF